MQQPADRLHTHTHTQSSSRSPFHQIFFHIHICESIHPIESRAIQLARQVSANGLALDGTAGDDYALAGSVANGLYRLYGDANADGVINAFDFSQFRNAFGSATGQTAYLDWLDLNGDGAINAFDFSQFRTRFGSGVP